jgi:hypothetical protein
MSTSRPPPPVCSAPRERPTGVCCREEYFPELVVSNNRLGFYRWRSSSLGDHRTAFQVIASSCPSTDIGLQGIHRHGSIRSGSIRPKCVQAWVHLRLCARSAHRFVFCVAVCRRPQSSSNIGNGAGSNCTIGHMSKPSWHQGQMSACMGPFGALQRILGCASSLLMDLFTANSL